MSWVKGLRPREADMIWALRGKVVSMCDRKRGYGGPLDFDNFKIIGFLKLCVWSYPWVWIWLKISGVGFADDISVMSTSLYTLQHLTDVCVNHSRELEI